MWRIVACLLVIVLNYEAMNNCRERPVNCGMIFLALRKPNKILLSKYQCLRHSINGNMQIFLILIVYLLSYVTVKMK